MAKGIHTRTGLRNVSETWDQNERKRGSDDAPVPEEPTAVGEDLKQVIREEAAEYDNANKEERVLGGERATVSDNPDESAPEE
jgi:hypothetical protein